MKLKVLKISGFQSFGTEPTYIRIRKSTFLIGPNGSGKTAVLQALCRMFAFDQRFRGVRVHDFHRGMEDVEDDEPRKLWIEAEFALPEAVDEELDASAIPPCFHHMKLEVAGDVPVLRIRLSATLYADGEIEESLSYVTQQDENGDPATIYPVGRSDRHYIQMHYLPARRDPSDHIAFTANALMGRYLRAATWAAESEALQQLNADIQVALGENSSIKELNKRIRSSWSDLHKSNFFRKPSVSFGSTDISRILKLLSISFSPAHQENEVEFSRLSDGQKSLLYLSLVLAAHSINRKIINGNNCGFDPEKLKPPIHTIVAMEEPENSLSPHYLGRVVNSLVGFSKKPGAQALIATHSPSILRRVDPRNIRYLRLDESRESVVTRIVLPKDDLEESKYIREAIQSFPEIYFSRLVILGEGDTEDIVLHRLLKASDLGADDVSISVAPLGGRHVNHFWRLLDALKIPCITLLDLDLGRFGGGWGRIKYAYKQLQKIGADIDDEYIDGLSHWGSDNGEFSDDIEKLERFGVFFSSPLDMDFMMLQKYPEAYGVTAAKKKDPKISTLKSVLGKRYNVHYDSLYFPEEVELFDVYHKKFKIDSKAVTHFAAMGNMTDEEILEEVPDVLDRLMDLAKNKLSELSE